MANRRIPLQKKDLTGDIQTTSGYIVALREYPFTANTILGTEATEAPGYYDFEDIEINVAYQLWAGTAIDTMTRSKAFSSEEGQIIYGNDDTGIIDANDYEVGELIVRGAAGFEPTTFQALFDASGIDVGGVNYLYCRGVLSQHNSVDSGKAFFGLLNLDTGTGTFVQSLINPELTIATVYNRSQSSKVSTGIYRLQFKYPNSSTSNFTTLLQGVFSYRFETVSIPIFKKLTVTEIDPGVEWEGVYSTEHIGWLILDTHSDAGATDYQSGILRIETRNTSGVLTDNLLQAGITIELRAFPLI